MFEQTVTHTTSEQISAGALLSAVLTERVAEQRAAANTLLLAYQWAVLHPADGSVDAAVLVFRGVDGAEYVPIVGEGCPQIAEFAVPEFGAVLGASTDAAKKLLGHAVELRHRLPRLWALVHDGRAPAWRARQVAEETIHASPRLSVEAADWVDRQVAAVAGKIGAAQLGRVIAEAIEHHHLTDPGAISDDDAAGALDTRHVTLHDAVTPYAGTVQIEAELDVADALDLDHAVRIGAQELKALGSQESLGARRSTALGHLARRQLALDLSEVSTPPVADADHGAHQARDLRVARRLDLYVHLTADENSKGLRAAGLGPTATLDNGHHLVLLDQVKKWCTTSHTEVRILPILDLNEEIGTHTYVPSPRLRRQVTLRDRTCVFPWCSRPARRCDLDHIDPYDHTPADTDPPDRAPPQTRTSNLATLCRRHHRLKTFTAWQLESPASGVFIWTSPHGHQFRRDSTGTEVVKTALRAAGRGPRSD